MSIIGKGYFEDGPGAWCGTKISVRETEDGPEIYSLELHLPPVIESRVLGWLFHSVLENVTNHRAGLGRAEPTEFSQSEYERQRAQKYWLVYEYGEIKAPPFAACALLSMQDLEALVFDENRGAFDIEEDSQLDENGLFEETPPLSAWIPAKDGSPFRVDPTRFGQ